MTDHRHNPRYKEDSDVIVKIQSSPSNNLLEGQSLPFHSKDISLTGIQLSVNTDIPVGSILELNIHLKHVMGNFTHLGSVVWNRGKLAHDIDEQLYRDIGVQFNAYANPQYNEWIEAVNGLIKRHRKFKPLKLVSSASEISLL